MPTTPMTERKSKEVLARLAAISDYLARIGAEGGKKGGKAGGKRKARSPEHYAKMVAARKAKRATDSGRAGK
jgi:hypothetical protein